MISRVSATSRDPAQPRQQEGHPLKSYVGDQGSYCHKERARRSRESRSQESRDRGAEPKEAGRRESQTAPQPSSRLLRSAARIPLAFGKQQVLSPPGITWGEAVGW